MDEKCSARMLALLAASLCTTPWCRSGEIPELSLPVDLMKDQNVMEASETTISAVMAARGSK